MIRPLTRRLLLALLATAGLTACLAAEPARSATAASGAPAVRAFAGVGPLMVIGGGADQDDIMRAFAREAGGVDARMAIFPWASGDPAKSGQAYVDYLAKLGFPHATWVKPADPAAIATATGLFFSGGDQTRIMAAMTPPWRAAIKAATARGAVVAGTSAGAMVWGSRIILEGDPMVTAFSGDDPAKSGIRLGDGLGLWPDLTVDTHFSERGRVPRIAFTLARRGQGVALGVDPQTAALIQPSGKLTVIGRGTVTVMRASKPLTAPVAGKPLSLRGLSVDILSAGDEAQAN